MDRNSITGIVLIVAILFGYTLWTMPSEEERAKQQRTLDSLAAVDLEQRAKAAEEQLKTATAQVPVASVADTTIDPIDRAIADSLIANAKVQRFGPFAPASEGTATEVTIGNSRLQVTISTHGARPTVMRLKEYQTYRKTPLILADPDSGTYEFKFIAGASDLSTRDLYFDAEDVKEDAISLIARTTDPAKGLRITYRLDSATYFLHTDVEFIGMKGVVDPRSLLFRWELAGLSNEKHQPSELQKCGVYYKYFNDDRNYLSETSAEEKKLEGRTNWVAFKQDFFTVAMVSEEGFSSNGSQIAINPLTELTHTKHYSAKLLFEKGRDAEPAASMRFYLGPNHFGTLRRTEVADFDRIIDLGWGIFGWMNQWLVIPIFNFLDGLNWSYGIIILVLTVVIKLLLMPLTYKNLVASAKMRVLKPETDAINAKFEKNDEPLKKQQATMELYRKAGVNPASGCVPMLIQLPVLYAMFRFFPASIELRQEKFLWADDLSSYDSILDLPFTIPAYGDHVSLFTLLMAASTIVYSVINQKQMPSQQNMPGMKMMIYLFPIMMLFFLNNFSSGLSYYYLLANLISIAQMTVLKSWFVDEQKIRAQLELNMRTPKKKSKWQQRLDDLQKQQQQRRK